MARTMAPEFHPTPYGPPLSLNDFPNEHGSKRKDAWEASLDSKTTLETATIAKEQILTKIGKSNKPSGLDIAIDRDYLLSLGPKKYALSGSELTQFEMALKRVHLDEMHALLKLSSDRTRSPEIDAPLYEPKKAESDIVLRSYLAASLLTKFSLWNINARPKRVDKNLPMLPSRLQNFVYLHSTTDLRRVLSIETEHARYTLLVFAYIIRRYAVGERIYRLNQIDKEMTRLWTRMYEEANPVKVKMFMNCLIMPFLCTLLSNEDLKLASFLNEAVQNAESMLKEIESISNEDLDVLFKSSQRTWDFGSALSFGTLLSLYLDCDRRELQRGTTESISRYLSDSYGKKGERLVSRLKRTKLHSSCMAVADQADKFLGIEFLHGYFEEIGFMTPDVHVEYNNGGFQRPSLAPESNEGVQTVHHMNKDKSINGSLSALGVRRSVLESSKAAFSVQPEPLGFAEAIAVVSDLDNWKAINQAIDEEAEEICKEIRLHGRLMKTLAVKVGKRRIPGPNAVRYCLARRVFVRWAIHCGDEVETGRKLGFIHTLNPRSKNERLRHQKDLENFQKYQREWSLRELSYVDPLNSVFLTEEETDFVSSRLE